MKTDNNSAYVQIETFNFSFTQQTIIVYCYLCSNREEIAFTGTRSYGWHKWCTLETITRKFDNQR